MARFEERWTTSTVGSAPAGWTAEWIAGGYVIHDNYGGWRIAHDSGSVSAPDAISYDAVGDVAAPVEALALFRQNGGGGGEGVVLLGANNNSSRDGYTGVMTGTSPGTLAILRSTGGSDTTLVSSTAINYLGTLYYHWLRVRRQGDVVTAKLWPWGSTEPGTWDLESTSTQPSAAGWVGVRGNGNRAIFERVVVETSGATCVSASATQNQWAVDFSTYSTGTGTPSGWSQMWHSFDTVAITASTAVEPGGKYMTLEHSAGGTARRGLQWDAGPIGYSSTVETLVKFRLSALTAYQFTPVQYAAGDSASENAYLAWINSGANLYPEVWINAVNTFNFRNQGSVFSLSSGVWYWMRTRFAGPALKYKLWADSTTEPASFSTIASHDNWRRCVSGRFGVAMFNSDAKDIAYFAVGLDGASAPTPSTSTGSTGSTGGASTGSTSSTFPAATAYSGGPYSGVWANGVDLYSDSGFVLDRPPGWRDAPFRSHRFVSLPKRRGFLKATADPSWEPRELRLSGVVQGDTNAAARANLRKLKARLSDGGVRYSFPDASTLEVVGYLAEDGIAVEPIGPPLADDRFRVDVSVVCPSPRYLERSTYSVGFGSTRTLMPLGTAPSYPVVTVSGATTFTLTYKTSTGGTVKTFGLSGATGAPFTIDMEAETVLNTSGDSQIGSRTTGSDFFALDPYDGTWTASSWPTLEVSAGSGTCVYRRAYLEG